MAGFTSYLAHFTGNPPRGVSGQFFLQIAKLQKFSVLAKNPVLYSWSISHILGHEFLFWPFGQGSKEKKMSISESGVFSTFHGDFF